MIRGGGDETWRHALPVHYRIAYNAPAGFNRPYGTFPGLSPTANPAINRWPILKRP